MGSGFSSTPKSRSTTYPTHIPPRQNIPQIPQYRPILTSPELQARCPRRPCACRTFEKYFNLLPTELKLLIIRHALDHEFSTPRTNSIHIRPDTCICVKTLAFPPGFHVSVLFRHEALRLAQRQELLTPLLAAQRSTEYRLTHASRLEGAVVHVYSRIATYLSNHLSKNKYPGPHLFNLDTCLLSLTLTHNFFWLNAFLRLSPALRSRIRYLQLVVERMPKYPQVPIWTLPAYARELDMLPQLMPALELVIMKREDFRMLPVCVEMYGNRWWLMGRGGKRLG
ncbi:hypothetical protein CC86DRAFT_412912 [Ophiobolus disseminans]|uniref:Uncharacterized protein n=1 Tax=Ophiobolus disseminans TaxID=1469910 RepID=A0A6A6ZFX2_9PLEO|nr:hypothetical protein CC86DRAFT_412912 [Ophiobolus disseminans]